jgi:hypothetical protein
VDTRPTRVYNFEIAEDHTYAVGELGAWVHNARKFDSARARKAWEDFYKKPWPTDIDGKNLIVHHIKYRCDGGSLYDPKNLLPMFPFGHRLMHSRLGDFVRFSLMKNK